MHLLSDLCETSTVYITNGLNPINFETNLTISNGKVAI